MENKVFLHLSVYSSHIYGPPTMCQALGQVPKTLYYALQSSEYFVKTQKIISKIWGTV